MSTAIHPSAGPFSAVLHATTSASKAVVRMVLVRPLGGVLRKTIRQRLHNYRVRIHTPDTLKPARHAGDEAPRVLVIGAGLAGISAATTLADRGVVVHLRERNPYLGGKLGAWKHTFGDGETVGIEHGYHAFFGCYYNLDRFLNRLGLRQRFTRTTDYRILLTDGDEMGFAGLESTPFLNLMHIVWKGIFDWRDFILHPQHALLGELVRYHPERTDARLDHMSFQAFARRHRVPEPMVVMFTTFSRAFFARTDQISMAAMLRSFHLYYTSNEAGLLHDHPADDHGTTLIEPIRAHLEGQGVRITTSDPVGPITRRPDRRFQVDGETYDHVVIATDVRGALQVLQQSPVHRENPTLLTDLTPIQPQNRYAVLRVWLDRDYRADLPTFTVTEKRKALDSLTGYHRAEAESAAWHQRTGGSVIELHAYQVPDDLKDEASIREALLDDLWHFLPELRGAVVVREVMQLRDDFTPFFTGMQARRPVTASGIDGITLAGDWVKLPSAAMLMEGAFTAGLLAANQILDENGLRTEPVYAVPYAGLLAKP